MNNTKDKNKKLAKILFSVLFFLSSGALAFIVFVSSVLFREAGFFFWIGLAGFIIPYIIVLAININFLQKRQYKAATYYSAFCLLAAALFLLISLM